MDEPSIKIAIVAGEPSGDQLGAGLIEALKMRYPTASFFGVGGPKMIEQGFDSWYPMATLSVNGLVEVLKHAPSLARMRHDLIEDLIEESPDIFIGIDSPDFNLGLETKLKASGITTVHYISPTIWAWRAERIRKIAKACDHILVLFPFEEPLYAKQGIGVTCVGHPMADKIPDRPDTAGARVKLGCESAAKVFALLPGSRNSEVHYHADLFVETAKQLNQRYPDSVFVMPAATRAARELFNAAIVRQCATGLSFLILDGQASLAIEAADVVIVASGTATLEAALWKKPMVITYRIAWLTWQIVKRMVKLECVGLPNILAKKKLVPEFLQSAATADNLTNAAIDWIEYPDRVTELIAKFDQIHASLRRGGSEAAATAVAKLLESHR